MRTKLSCGRALGSARASTSNCWPSRIMRSLTALMRSARARTSSGRGRASISSDSSRSPDKGVRNWCAAWPMKRRCAASDASRRSSRSLVWVTSGSISTGTPTTSRGCMSSMERCRISSDKWFTDRRPDRTPCTTTQVNREISATCPTTISQKKSSSIQSDMSILCVMTQVAARSSRTSSRIGGISRMTRCRASEREGSKGREAGGVLGVRSCVMARCPCSGDGMRSAGILRPPPGRQAFRPSRHPACSQSRAPSGCWRPCLPGACAGGTRRLRPRFR